MKKILKGMLTIARVVFTAIGICTTILLALSFTVPETRILGK